MGGFGTGINALYLNGSSFGMGQGLNVQSVVQSLTQAAQASESQYTDEQTLYNSQISALTNVNSLLTSFQIATQTLQDPAGPLAARDATSSNTSVVTATAASGISTGSYSVTVNRLASSSTYIGVAQAVSSTTGQTALATGKITYEIGGKPYEIDVNAANNNMTLNSLASYISGNSNFGVTASVIPGANGATLSLTSRTSGAAGEITNMSDTLGLGLGGVPLSAASSLQGSSTAAVNDGTISYSVGGSTYSIDVSQGNDNETLDALASYINQNSTDLGGVTASVVTGSSGSYLTLSSSTGAIANISDSTGLNLSALQASATSSAQSSSAATIANGTISYTIGSSKYQVKVSSANSNNTLADLASYINQNSATLGGATASVLAGASGSYLALTSPEGEITNISDTTGLNFCGFQAEPVSGQDASVTVNGVTVPESSNTVAINGVTFNLQGVSTSPVTVTVGQDVDQAATAINDFVSAYNAVAQAVNTQFTYTAGASSQPPLFSDSSLQQVQSTLAADINYFIKGNNGITSLASLGVNLQQDGTLSVNSAALTAALSNNATAVANFFQGPDYTSGLAGQLYKDLGKLTDPTQGVIALDENGINQELQDVTQTINEFNANLLLQEQQWTMEYSQVNATLQELPLLIAQASGQASTVSSSSNSSSSSSSSK